MAGLSNHPMHTKVYVMFSTINIMENLQGYVNENLLLNVSLHVLNQFVVSSSQFTELQFYCFVLILYDIEEIYGIVKNVPLTSLS